MIESIKQIEDWQNRTPEQIRSAFQSDVAVPRGLGDLTNKAFGKLFGPQAADLLYQTIESSFKSYAMQYVTVGIDTTEQSWKDTIDAIDTSASPELSEIKPVIRDWENTTSTLWESIGNSGDVPSHDQIESAINKDQLESEWVAIQNDGGINAAIAAGDRTALVSALNSAANSIAGT